MDDSLLPNIVVLYAGIETMVFGESRNTVVTEQQCFLLRRNGTTLFVHGAEKNIVVFRTVSSNNVVLHVVEEQRRWCTP